MILWSISQNFNPILPADPPTHTPVMTNTGFEVAEMSLPTTIPAVSLQHEYLEHTFGQYRLELISWLSPDTQYGSAYRHYLIDRQIQSVSQTLGVVAGAC